jgi:hypothetical protein
MLLLAVAGVSASVSCAKSLYTNGDPGIAFSVFRPGQCLAFDIAVVPFYFTFSASPSATVTRYTSKSNFDDADIAYNGTTPDVSWMDRIEDGPTRLVFSFTEDTYFSIAYAGFSNFNCSRILISDAPSFTFSDFLSLPALTSVCLFYGAHGTHTISGSMGAGASYPTIEIYSGIKHRLASISSQVSNFTFTQPGADTPTFVIITPPSAPTGTQPVLNFELRTDGTFVGKTMVAEFYAAEAPVPPRPVTWQRHSGDLPAILFIGIYGSGILILGVFVICKERNWYRDDYGAMELGMLSYESQVASYMSQDALRRGGGKS